jgi:hypothetical protein
MVQNYQCEPSSKYDTMHFEEQENQIFFFVYNNYNNYIINNKGDKSKI